MTNGIEPRPHSWPGISVPWPGSTRKPAERQSRLLRRRLTFAVFALAAAAAGPASAASGVDPRLAAVAREARQAIAVIDWFYVRHRACPQPSRPEELAELQSELGDGYSVAPQGPFVAIRGISMISAWLYYTSPRFPDRCTLWRKLGWDPALIWRREGGYTFWVYDPGDGSAERRIRPAP